MAFSPDGMKYIRITRKQCTAMLSNTFTDCTVDSRAPSSALILRMRVILERDSKLPHRAKADKDKKVTLAFGSRRFISIIVFILIFKYSRLDILHRTFSRPVGSYGRWVLRAKYMPIRYECRGASTPAVVERQGTQRCWSHAGALYLLSSCAQEFRFKQRIWTITGQISSHIT